LLIIGFNMQAYSKFRQHVFSLFSYNINSTTSLLLVIILLLSFSLASPGLFRYVSAFVHIVSPEKQEAVPAGSSLTVSGNSDDNPQFNCKVLIIVNDKRPYQETIPVRPGDYSKWTFVVTPQYTEIQEGINTITSKATCDSQYEPVLKLDPLTKEYVKYYGINVTGMPSGSELGSQEPFVFQAPGENSREEGGDGTVGGESEDGK
jgi:hypothetical protein